MELSILSTTEMEICLKFEKAQKAKRGGVARVQNHLNGSSFACANNDLALR